MAIENYSDLASAVGQWAKRGDLEAIIPSFIVLPETMFSYGDDEDGFSPLRTANMVESDSLTATNGEATLSAYFLGVARHRELSWRRTQLGVCLLQVADSASCDLGTKRPTGLGFEYSGFLSSLESLGGQCLDVVLRR